jgi:hypothetical protein
MKPRGFAIALVALGMLALFFAPFFVANHYQNIVLLERLAPRVERAQTLAPEARDAILQLVGRVRDAPIDRRADSRRALAIERIAAAISKKDPSYELSSVGRRSD